MSCRRSALVLRECLAQHPVPLGFERLISHLMCPHGGSDRFSHLQEAPCLGLARVAAVALEEGLLETRIGTPLLHREAAEVGGGGPVIESAE